MNPALTPPELRGLLKNAGCAGVGVAGEAYADRLREAGATTVFTEADLAGDPRRHQDPTPPTSPTTADALILFTSGTTGTPQGGRHHQRPAEQADQGNVGTIPCGCGTVGRDDVRPVLPCRRLPGHARQLVLGQHLGGAEALRRRRMVTPGVRASGDRHVLGADHAATDPRPSRLRRHRSDVAGRHRLRRRRRADRVGAQGDGRAPKGGVRQRLRPDRDARRVHHAAARRPPRSRPRGIRRPAATRGRGASGGPRHRRRRRAGDGRRVVGEHRPERHGRLAAHRRPGPPGFRRLHLPERPAQRHHQPRGREVRADRGRGSAAFPSGGHATSRSPGSPTRNWASGWGPRWWLARR